MTFMLASIVLMWLIVSFPLARAIHRGLDRALDVQARLTPTSPKAFFWGGLWASLKPWGIVAWTLLAMAILAGALFAKGGEHNISRLHYVVLSASWYALPFLYAGWFAAVLAPRWKNAVAVAFAAALLTPFAVIGFWFLFHHMLPKEWLWSTVQHSPGLMSQTSLVSPYLAAVPVLGSAALWLVRRRNDRWLRLPAEEV